MEPARAAQALAEASSSMTKAHDIVGTLASLLRNCQTGLGVDAGGILVDAGGRLQLLASSSHQAAELETHQLHADEGPCVEAHAEGTSVQAHSAAEITRRWPNFGKTMLAAGFQSVHAAPLVFQGSAFGAMGLFRRSDHEFLPEEDVVAQAFADIATMLIFHLDDVPAQQRTDRLLAALDGRVLIEQAKGLLADSHDLSMADAYDLLVQSADDRRQDVTSWASQLITDAQSAG